MIFLCELCSETEQTMLHQDINRCDIEKYFELKIYAKNCGPYISENCMPLIRSIHTIGQCQKIDCSRYYRRTSIILN